MWSVAPVCGARNIPAYVHPADRELLSDPAKGLPLQPGQQLLRGITFTEPDDVVELTGGMTLELAGVQVVADHAPGHTPGSLTFRLPGGTEPGTLFSGDLLFAGSIGRTDLPGGDYTTILESLARVCLPLPDETVVLSGHGPRTTIGAERVATGSCPGWHHPAGRPGPVGRTATARRACRRSLKLTPPGHRRTRRGRRREKKKG